MRKNEVARWTLAEVLKEAKKRHGISLSRQRVQMLQDEGRLPPPTFQDGTRPAYSEGFIWHILSLYGSVEMTLRRESEQR